MSPANTVAVLGAGSIGVAFAIVFSRAGFPVRVWDPDPAAPARAGHDLRDRLTRLRQHGLLDEEPGVVAARVAFVPSVADAVDGAGLVQECAPERAEVKRELFAKVTTLTGPEVVLASSSSAIPASVLAEGLASAGRILIGHPGNPPYLLPVIEVVPSPETEQGIVERASTVYRAAGLRPVELRREVEGFVFNRLQGALLREAYCLLRDGVADVEDIDSVVRLGLGRRWSVVGPFETADLNTRGGIGAHAEKMGPSYERMGAERGQHDPWTLELVARAVAQRRAMLPLAEWDERVRWRDERLMELERNNRD
ncbi:3-hydroxyacyl-CoA dehydrogenase [Prauserella marina]|uniref:3-hydroxyacyl-CoA dehydrogenase n=1 Tax=Prauserella marina TaxID=530584 RepID=UPI000B8A2832|nr:3-hydroxyacyl-CoA dehydrogenase [Prauserella marina]